MVHEGAIVKYVGAHSTQVCPGELVEVVEIPNDEQALVWPVAQEARTEDEAGIIVKIDDLERI